MSARYLSQGVLDGRDENGASQGNFSAFDAAVGAVYGRKLASGAAAGIGVKEIESGIANDRARTWAVDLGLKTPTPLQGLSAGLAARNLGPGLKFDGQRSPLPALLSGGLQYAFSFGPEAAAEVVRDVNARKTTVRAGMEYTILGFSVRGGYEALEQASQGAAGWAAGLGWRWKSLRLDYAVAPTEEGLGDRQTLTLRVGL